MKKAIIAGAASAVLAAMPVMGVFAAPGDGVTDSGTNPLVDSLNLTIDTACTFKRNTVSPATAHTDGFGRWGNDGNDQTDTDAPDTLYATVLNGKIYDDGTSGKEAALGSSSFVVDCNNQAGYKVTVTASPFAATNTETNAQGEYAWGYTAGGNVVTSGNSMWTIATDKTGVEQNIAQNIVATKGAPVSSDTFNVTYKAFVDLTQPADTYTATAQYLFAQL